MGLRTCIALFTRLPDLAHLEAASRRARCAGCCRCCAEWWRTASRTISPSCSTRRARRSATTGTRNTRPIARRCPTTSSRRSSRCTSCVRAHGWPLLMVEGVEADDVIGTLASQGARTRGIDTHHLLLGQGPHAARATAASKMVNTMSNETFDEAGVLAKFDVRADQVLDLLTLTGDTVDNVPGVAKVGPKTAAKWLAQYGTLDNLVAHADEIGGVVGNNLREALPWLPQGRRLLTVKTDCDAAGRPADLAHRARWTPPTLSGAVRALRVQGVAEGRERVPAPTPDRREREARPAPSRARAPRWSAAGSAPAHGVRPRRRADTIASTRRCIDEAALAALARRDRPRRARRPSISETTSLDPMLARIVGVSLAVDAGPRVLHPARAPLRRRARRSSIARRRSRASRPGSPTPRQAKLGQNLKYDEHALANEGLRAARRRARHAARIVRARVAQAARHGQPRVAAPRPARRLHYDDVTGKGANRIPFEQVAVERADRVCGRGRRRHAAAASRAASGIAADAEARASSTRRSRCRCARCCSAWSATASSSTPRLLGDAEPGAGRARARRSSSRPISSPASRSTWARRSRSGRDPVPAHESAGA